MTDTTTFEISRIEGPYKASALEGVNADVTTITWLQMVEVSKLMARAGIALPPHARDNPAVCWAIMMQTRQWNLSNPFFIANNSYVVRNKEGVETLAYNSAVFQAVLLASKATKGPPQYAYEGEGDDRRCTVSVIDAQTGEWQELRTPPLRMCRARSPLWVSNPDQQLGYYGLRNLVRLKYQDVLGGFYDRDEFTEEPKEPQASPNLIDRLPGRIEGDGFQPDAAELQREEREAVAVVQAARRGRPKGSRNKVSMKDLPDIKPFPEEGGLTGTIEYATLEAPEKPVDASETQEAVTLPPEPQSQPAATAETLQLGPMLRSGLAEDDPPYRGPPRNQGEYIAYAERKIRGYGAGNVEAWYMGTTETALRAQCSVNDLTFKMLGTLVREKANGGENQISGS